MISDYLRLSINSFDKVLLPAIEAGCAKKDIAAARVFQANLYDLLSDLAEWERNAGPDRSARIASTDLPAGVVPLNPFARSERGAAERPAPGGDAA